MLYLPYFQRVTIEEVSRAGQILIYGGPSFPACLEARRPRFDRLGINTLTKAVRFFPELSLLFADPFLECLFFFVGGFMFVHNVGNTARL